MGPTVPCTGRKSLPTLVRSGTPPLSLPPNPSWLSTPTLRRTDPTECGTSQLAHLLVCLSNTMKDPVWVYVTAGSKSTTVICTFCTKELYRHPTYLKTHIMGSGCSAPPEVKSRLEHCLS